MLHHLRTLSPEPSAHIATQRTQPDVKSASGKLQRPAQACSPGRKNCARKKSRPKDGLKKVHVSSEKACGYR